MKVALIVHDFLNGVGHGRYCIELARRFTKNHEVHVFANRFEPKLDFPFHPQFVPAWRKTALTSVLTFPRAAQGILELAHYDVVHSQGFCCERADVITAHVCNAARYRRSPAKGILKRIFPWLVIPRERNFYRQNSRAKIISISKVIQTELAAEYSADSEVIYHGVDTASFAPKEKEPGKAWRWLFVGEAVKGLSEAIEAVRSFPNAHLEVVTRSSVGPWKDWVRQLNLEHQVTFRGPVEYMAEIYQAADVFIYPSRYDAFGMVVAEAMASGLPVIAGKDIGASEWIVDGVNGFLCHPEKPASILTQLQKLKESGSADISRSARNTALRHTWDDCAQKTIEIYERAMASNRQRQ